jgi:hypothetical protein
MSSTCGSNTCGPDQVPTKYGCATCHSGYIPQCNIEGWQCVQNYPDTLYCTENPCPYDAIPNGNECFQCPAGQASACLCDQWSGVCSWTCGEISQGLSRGMSWGITIAVILVLAVLVYLYA